MVESLESRGGMMVSRRRTESPNVSILILTLNEEGNIQPCLDSVAWSNDIVVLDSGSRDKTTQLAKKSGARVVYRAFDDFAGQQNYAVKKIRFKNRLVVLPGRGMKRVTPG